ncbi:shikimate dehydrogenase family protein [Klebsiella pneumoniae]|uniref:shikimate dehydrogenase family protein n=1 Tax=Klebsiella pneumoniae TaxID=573 RepID=UPI000B4CE42E|nr:hypothetical protein [Klebsiella pneumoniae]MBD7304409.1 hypothetical protein [Klebsiella pneumoniae]MBD7310460.1 hypothetical protein [Klebsiella pneumoniae]NBF34662.1 hypothetical protein [Klebsiella pneumoniae]OWQ31200.1 hypothetical protein B7462_09995 [Klebsiella pneumoniae]
MVSGTTQVVAVIGHPIAQVKSPDNFNRYFAEQHMDSIMIPVDIVPDAVAAYLNALRGWQNMTGVLVTVPHKQRAAALVDDLTPRARRLNAVNVIRKLADGRLQGDMLDGVGFQLAAEAQGFQPAGKQALLDTLDSTTHVADVVTAPVMTPLLTFAAARGCKVQTGPEMALAQMRLMGQFIGAIPQAQGAAA